jgi:hypothetical protein
MAPDKTRESRRSCVVPNGRRGPARHRRSSSRCGIYSGQAEVLFDASRPGFLNGIEDIATRPDLANRLLFLTLEQSHPSLARSAAPRPSVTRATPPLDESPWRHRSRSGQPRGEGMEILPQLPSEYDTVISNAQIARQHAMPLKSGFPASQGEQRRLISSGSAA